MNALVTRKAIQALLGVTADGVFGPKSTAAFQALATASEWPQVASQPVTSPNQPSKVFLDFMPFIFEAEGETYENDPKDPGGETKYGIDKRSHPSVDIKSLTKDQAMAIYWDEWNRDRCDALASPFAEVFFDTAVNMGLGRAQQFVGALEPGPRNASTFLDRRDAYYRHLGADPNYAGFLKGWLNRTAALRKRFGLA